MTLPPNYWFLGRDEYVDRCTKFCNRLLSDLVGRYDKKYDDVNPSTGKIFGEPNLFAMDLEREDWEEFVDRIGYGPIMNRAKQERFAALSGNDEILEDQ